VHGTSCVKDGATLRDGFVVLLNHRILRSSVHISFSLLSKPTSPADETSTSRAFTCFHLHLFVDRTYWLVELHACNILLDTVYTPGLNKHWRQVDVMS